MKDGKIAEAKNKYGTVLFFKPRQVIEISRRQMNELTLEIPITKIVECGDYDYFIDIGAGFGYYSKIASYYAKKVFSFEPHPIRHGFVKWNMLGLDNVEVFDWYIGMKSPHIRKDNPYGMVRIEHPETTMPYDVISHSLTDLLHNGIIPQGGRGLIKIDVEGNEIDVIKSAFPLKDFESYKWIVEIHNTVVNLKEVLDLFEGWEKKKLEIPNRNQEHYLFWKG